MNLQKLFLLQKTLDEHIETEHNLVNQNLIDKKILALLVELGELANETRCFKFWSKKGPSPRDVILEEYVDCLHFILSIGLECGFGHISITPNSSYSNSDLDITELLLELNIHICNFIKDKTYNEYDVILNKFLVLGESLSFSLQDIEFSYLNKNKINHERQNQGY